MLAVPATSEAEFSALAERHRRELHVHCYRMMGSFEEAEDLVQETLLRAWRSQAELGPSGVRVVGIHTAAVRGTLTAEKVERVSGARVDVEAVLAGVAGMAVLRRVPEVQQVADTAAFLASDRAAAITGTIVNATCGLVL